MQQRARSEPARRSAARDERPPAPRGWFPLQELTVLAGLVILLIGFFGANPIAIAVGIVLGCLAGLELSLREHFAGYRSHTMLLAGSAFVLAIGPLLYFGGPVLLIASRRGRRFARPSSCAPGVPACLRLPTLQSQDCFGWLRRALIFFF